MKAEDCKLFSHFFEGDKRQYIIPVYQRNYDWKVENCKKLFDDIVGALERDKAHFVGSIVQVQKDEENGIKPFIVIDGQQRLTTVYLLLKAIYDAATRENTKEDLKDVLFNKFKDDPSIRDDKNKLKLKANTKDNKQLLLLMDGRVEEVDKQSSVYTNYEYFYNLIRDEIKSGKYEAKDLKRGVEKLTAVVISLKEEHGDDPQAIFERINSTGVELELDDLIRNFVLMTDMNQETLFTKYWLYIEDSIPKNKRPNFFIDFLNAYTVSSKVSKEEAYNKFKEWAKGKTSETILQSLKKAAKSYSVFIQNSKEYSKQVNEKLEGFRRINQSTLFTLLFPIFDDYEDGIIDEKVLNDVLSLLLNYSIRRIVCEIPSQSLRGLYKTLYKRVFADIEKTKEVYLDALVSMLVENLKNSKDCFPSDSLFIRGLCETKIYSRNSKFCKYILGKLENHRSKEKIDVDTNEITIEHIMPQKYPNKDWAVHLGPDYEKVYNTYLDTLGNVTLTGYNSNLSDKSFAKKQEELKKCGTKIAFLNQEFISSNVWNEEVIKARSDRLANAIKEIFAYPNWSGKDYHPINIDNLIRVTLHNPDDCKDKTAVYYDFMGERNEVTTFKAALFGVLENLYGIDETILQELAQTNFSSTGGQTHLSYNKDRLKKPNKMESAEIFAETQFNSNSILLFIRKLLEQYEIEESEFVLYCK